MALAQPDPAAMAGDPAAPGMAARALHRRARVVVLTDIEFWTPTYGSHSRIVAMLMALSAFYDVTVFCLSDAAADAEAAIAARNWPFELVPYAAYRPAEAEDACKPGPLANVPDLKKFVRHDWFAAAAAYLRQAGAVAGIVQYAKLAYLADAFPPGCARILDTHDAQSHRTRVFAAFGKVPSLAFGMEAERRILSSFDAVLGITTKDCYFFSRQLRLRNVLYAPHAVQARPAPVAADPRRLVFVGAASEPNVEGLLWFLRQVWPVLRSTSTLSIVGTVGTLVPADLLADERIVRHGVVDDLSGVYERGIAINPVFFGGGMKIKSLDALAAGCPLVTTEEGARGLEPWEGKAFLVARSRSEFIGCVLALQNDPAACARLGHAAIAAVDAHLAPMVAYRDLIGFLAACGPQGDRVRR